MKIRFGIVWWGFGLLGAALVVWGSLIPPGHGKPLIHDKLAHFLAYGWLMFWFGQMTAGWRVAVVGVVLALMGVGLEFAQRATGYRVFDINDMIANSFGVACGIVVAQTQAGRLVTWLDRTLGRLVDRAG
jgi:VanZ family protein